jgi:hypothetical protein
MIEEVEDVYNQLEDLCWSTPIFRYISEKISNFNTKWFFENEKKVYEWWEKHFDEFKNDLESIWEEDEGVEALYDDFNNKWEELIRLVRFKNDEDLLHKIGNLEDDIDNCYEMMNNEMPYIVKETILEIFEE